MSLASQLSFLESTTSTIQQTNNNIIIASNSGAASTTTGALQIVNGGLSVGGGAFIGGILTATSYYGVFAGTFAASVSITTSTNIAGGTAGQLHYQSAAGLTAFAGPGSYGQFLMSTGASAPVYQSTLTQVNGNIVVTSNSAATSTATGALQIVNGGLGVGGAIYSGGNISIGAASPLVIGGGVVGQTGGNLTLQSGGTGQNYTHGGLRLINNGGAELYGGSSGLSTGTNAGVWLNGGYGEVNITKSTGVASTNSGALQVWGGIGVNGGGFFGGIVTATTYYGTFAGTIGAGTTISTATNIAGGTAGQLHYQSAAGLTAFAGPGSYGQFLMSTGASAPVYQSTLTQANGNIIITSNTAATSTATGALQIVNGGAGIGGDIYAGGNLNVGSNARATTVAVYSNNTIGNWNGHVIQRAGTEQWFAGSDNASGQYVLRYNANWNWLAVNTFTGVVTISTNTSVSSTTTGGLVVTGGLGVGGGGFFGGIVTATTYYGTFAGTIATGVALTTATNIAGGTAGQVPYQTAAGATSFFGPGTAGQILLSNGAAAPVYTNTSSIYVNSSRYADNVTGGAGGSLHYQSAANATAMLSIGSANTILVSNGTTPSWTANPTIGGNVTITGNLTVQGVTTTVDSTVTNIADPIITIGGGANGAAPTSDDAKDRGIAFQWYDTATTPNMAKIGFFGFDRSSKYFTFLTSSTFVNEITAGAGGTTKGALDAYLAGGTTGSIPYQTAADVTGFLAIGTNGYVLTSNGTTPTWSALSGLSAGTATTATNLASGTAGQVPYQSAAGSTSFFGPGTAGQILLSNGAAAPVYTNTSSIYVNSSRYADNVTGGAGGSIHYQSAANTTAMLGIGTAGYVLYSNGSTPSWVAPSTLTAGTATNIAGGAAGSLPYQSGVAQTTMLNIGTAGYVLTSDGTKPVWTSATGVASGTATTATNLASGTAGQVPYQTAAGATSFFGPGTAGQILLSNGAAAPVYTNTSSIYVNSSRYADNLTGGAGGSIPYQSAANTTALLGIGTNGYVLTSNGSAPVWSAASGITAGYAAQVQTTAQPAAGTNYVTFVNANNASATAMTVYTTSSLTINPGTGFVGVGSSPDSTYRLGVANTIKVGTQGGTDVTIIGGGAGTGSYLRGYYGTDGSQAFNIIGNGTSYVCGSAAAGGNFYVGTTTNYSTERMGVNGTVLINLTNSTAGTATSAASLIVNNPAGSQSNILFNFAGLGRSSFRADSTGNLIFNATSGNFYLNNDAGPATVNLLAVSTAFITGSSSGAQIPSLGVGTAPSGTAGEIRATNEITAYYSDRRLKENVQTIDNAVTKVLSLNGITYTPNDLAASYGYDKDVKLVGLFADEVEAVLPEATRPAPFDQDEDGNSKSGENYKTIQYEKLVPLLVEAIKEQQKTIDALLADLSEIKKQLGK